MAQVTIELRALLRIPEFDLFDFDYPLSNELKEEFEDTFKDHYFFYEIGAETADRFKHNLKARLKMKAPYYSKLFETTKLEFDPLINYDMEEDYTEGSQQATTGSKSEQGDGSSTATTTENKDDTRTEYPQHSNIANDIPTERIGQKSTSDTSTTGESSSTSNESTTVEGEKDYRKTLKGIQGNPNELLRQYRENILDIVHNLVNDCKDLFILVY